jgi:hypothetical protein
MNNEIILKIVNELSRVDRMKKTIREAELELSIQKDIEQKKKAKRERQTAWILHGGKYPD